MARILLLESDHFLAKNLSRALEKDGSEVSWHVDLQAAMNSADQNTPEVVILDLSLAARSGTEFLYEFRSYPDWENVPVIILSSLSNHEIKDTISSLSHLNVSTYLYKPTAGLSDLVENIRRLLLPQPA